MTSWEPIEGGETGEQFTDDLPQTDEISFWGELRPNSARQWQWQIMATDTSLDQWVVDGGVADSAEKARIEVEHWQPLSGLRWRLPEAALRSVARPSLGWPARRPDR